MKPFGSTLAKAELPLQLVSDFLKDLKQYTTADKRNDMIAGYISNFPVYREPGFKFTEIPCNNNFMFLKMVHGQ